MDINPVTATPSSSSDALIVPPSGMGDVPSQVPPPPPTPISPKKNKSWYQKTGIVIPILIGILALPVIVYYSTKRQAITEQPKKATEITNSPTPIGSAAFLRVLGMNVTNNIPSMPTIRGKAEPGWIITISIPNASVSYSTTANANGDWEYTPGSVILDGNYPMTVTAKNADGSKTQTLTAPFQVNCARVTSTPTPTGIKAIVTATPTKIPVIINSPIPTDIPVTNEPTPKIPVSGVGSVLGAMTVGGGILLVLLGLIL